LENDKYEHGVFYLTDLPLKRQQQQNETNFYSYDYEIIDEIKGLVL